MNQEKIKEIVQAVAEVAMEDERQEHSRIFSGAVSKPRTDTEKHVQTILAIIVAGVMGWVGTTLNASEKTLIALQGEVKLIHSAMESLEERISIRIEGFTSRSKDMEDELKEMQRKLEQVNQDVLRLKENGKYHTSGVGEGVGGR